MCRQCIGHGSIHITIAAAIARTTHTLIKKITTKFVGCCTQAIVGPSNNVHEITLLTDTISGRGFGFVTAPLAGVRHGRGGRSAGRTTRRKDLCAKPGPLLSAFIEMFLPEPVVVDEITEGNNGKE